ncbi:MAG: hypothetical protein FWD34_10815 [Oscillospiraceae bacterium]|nr:hypothetical protein [Oscillospiraceae bacterium]
MSKTLTQKLLDKEEEIKKNQKELKQLRQQEKAEADKARIRRQTNRGGLLEKLIPHLAELSDSEFESYINKALSPAPPPVISQGGILMERGDENDEE